MATNYPNSLDSLTNPTTNDPVNNPSHAVQHANANYAIEALQTKVGTNNSAVETSLDYRIKQLELNPGVTQSYVDAAISNLSNTSSTTYVPQSDVGQVDGVASLDSTGKIPDAQIPDGIARDSEVSTAIANLVNSAPSTLDTLNELATALGNDANFSTTITNSIGGKVSKSGGDTITAVTASTKGLIIQGAASQSANLQEWKNSSGAVLAYIGPSGTNYLGSVVTVGNDIRATYGIHGGGLNTQSSAMGIQSWVSSMVGFLVKGSASQTANLQEWQDSSGTVLAKITSDGSFQTGGGSWTKIDKAFGQVAIRNDGALWGSLSVGTGSAALPGVVIRGAASQTANLQEWQNSAGTVLAKITSGGNIELSATGSHIRATDDNGILGWPSSFMTRSSSTGLITFTLQNFSGAGFQINSGNAASKPLVIRGAASQTANLQEWQNSDGTVLARITGGGVLAITSNIYASRYYFSSNATSTLSSISFMSGAQGQGLSIKNIDIGTPNAAFDNVVPLTVSGNVNQTANLQQWKNGSGTVLAKITSTGAFDATAITVNGSPVSGGALYQTTAPLNPEVGQIWVDSDDNIEAFDLTNKKTEIAASISANTNLVAGRRYFVTSGSALTLTLPASPALNDEIQILDASGNASTYNITVARNGKLINGTAGNLIIDNNGGWYSLLYTGNTYGWKVG